jgi:hypothetical protein
MKMKKPKRRFASFLKQKQENVCKWIARILGSELAFNAQDDNLISFKNIQSREELLSFIIKEQQTMSISTGKEHEGLGLALSDFSCLPYVVKQLFTPNSKLKSVISDRDFSDEINIGIKSMTNYYGAREHLKHIPDSETTSQTSSDNTISVSLLSNNNKNEYLKAKYGTKLLKS